jgi:hypothetical protein
MECLGGVLQAKGHENEFEETKRCGNCHLLDVIRVDRNLVVSPQEINFGEGGAARKAVGIVLYV